MPNRLMVRAPDISATQPSMTSGALSFSVMASDSMFLRVTLKTVRAVESVGVMSPIVVRSASRVIARS